MTAFLGIDIAKASLAVALRRQEQVVYASFDNNAAGFDQLQQWLVTQGVEQVVACLEATGRYGQALAVWLWQQGHCVSIVNPKQIKAFAKTVQTRTKNDRVDAGLIAHFAQLHRPRLWSPPDPAREHLQQLIRQRQSLLDIKQADVNRLKAGAHAPLVRQLLEARLALYGEQLAALEAAINDHIAQHRVLARQHQLLITIPGIGKLTAAVILGELPDIRRFQRPGQLVAYAGLDPSEHHSGTTVRKPTKISRQGNARLRCALYFPGVVGQSRCAFYRPLVERLTARHHCKMSIIVAVMRKLLHLVFGVLKHQQPFDPDYLAKKAQLA